MWRELSLKHPKARCILADDADLPKWRKLCGALSADNDQAGKGYFLRRLAEVTWILYIDWVCNFLNT